MSIAGLIDPEMNHHKKSFHRRNDSGELDVFEAARYFSGYNESVVGYNYNNNHNYTYTHSSNNINNHNNNKIMMMREDHRHGHNRARISLDMPIRTLLPQQFQHGVAAAEKQIKEKIKQKQPSSPGGRLASFLNSLFSQSASRKKKSKSTTQSMKDHHHEDESPGGRRRRRISISHFRSSSSVSSTADSISISTSNSISNSNSNSKSTFSSLSSGFRTPPYVVQTPTKSCKEFRTAMSAKHNTTTTTIGDAKPTTLQSEFLDEKKKIDPASFSDDSYNNTSSNNNKQRKNNWISDLTEKENKENLRKLSDEVDDNYNDDDGGDSDSSSDLFELQNYDLGYYSSGLPVYETTNMDTIKRTGTPISN